MKIRKIHPYISFCALLSFFLFPLLINAQNKNEILRVMAFNIRYDNPDDGSDIWTNRKDNVISMINFYDADIIGTQEVLKNQKVYLDEHLKGFISVGVGRENGVDKGEFSAVFFKRDRFELLNSGTFWLSETPEVIGSVGWDAALERISTWVKLKDKTTNNEFFVFNTHYDHMGQQARIKSSELLIEKIKSLSGELPVILTGDFNVTKDNDAYKTIVADEDLKMYDSQFSSSQPHHGPNWTFHGFEEVPVNERPKIDYIFVNNKVTVLKHGILSDRFDGGYPSDHLPVLIEAIIK